jgi:hypothetical protein
MTLLERLETWKADGVITGEQHASLSSLSRGDRFSLYVELNALLYLGVISIIAGLTWTFRDYVADLGHAAILSILGLLMVAAFWYCFSKGQPYSNAEIEHPSMLFDYVLYFGCLVFAATLAYLETQLNIFRGWDTHLLAASFVYAGLAYRFDNRFVLSLALSTLAAYLGLKLEIFEDIDTNLLRFYAFGYALFVAGAGFGLHRQGIKRHFLDVYLHVSANVVLVAAVSGVLEPSIGLLYLAVLLSLAAASIYLGVHYRRFAFVAYGTVYGYAGISVRVLEAIGGVTPALAYFAVTGTGVVIALVVLARRFGREE